MYFGFYLDSPQQESASKPKVKNHRSIAVDKIR